MIKGFHSVANSEYEIIVSYPATGTGYVIHTKSGEKTAKYIDYLRM